MGERLDITIAPEGPKGTDREPSPARSGHKHEEAPELPTPSFLHSHVLRAEDGPRSACLLPDREPSPPAGFLYTSQVCD